MTKLMLRNLVFGAVLVLGLATAGAAGSPGSVDGTYGTGGVADGGPFVVGDAAVASDGAIVMVGTTFVAGSETYAVQKITSAGVLDTNFGTNGTVEVFGAPPTSLNFADAVGIGPDGRIFIGGRRSYEIQVTSGRGKKQTTTTETVQTGSLLKLNADGSIDTGFGDDGYLDTGWSTPNHFTFRGTSSSYEVVFAAHLQVEVTVSGSGKGKKGGSTTIDTTAQALYAVDGDTGGNVTSFGDSGEVVDDFSTSTNEWPEAVEIDALGRIVVLSRESQVSGGANDMVVSRYSSTGVLDTAFGTSGRLYLGHLGNWDGMSMTIDGDGKRIIISARTPTTNGHSEPTVVRYAENGSSIDTTFDVPGLADSSDGVIDTWPIDMNVDANGKLCVSLWYGSVNFDMTIVRCNADGTRDTGFGPNADGLAEILDLSDEEEPKTSLIDGSGRLILVRQSSQAPDAAVLVRFDG